MCATSSFTLDPWQLHLCQRLQRLAWERGQRVLIHAPPQFGKSIIVSQRFPAWLLAKRPTERIRLAAYNITHASRFGKIVRDLMQEDTYARLFPAEGLRLGKNVSAEAWSTAARLALRDAQPSFMALGLVTGFVGQGADTLIIDDPYASPQDAISPAVRESVWMFWSESARVRINDETNVVVMFHRYHEDDLAGRLMEREGLKSEGGAWELMRYAAVADGDERMPDPMGRAVGEKLTPRVSDAFLAEQEQNGQVWLSQFQGRPTPRGGSVFRVAALEIVAVPPANLRLMRAWDQAATSGGGDYTAGVLMGTADNGVWYVLDVVRDRWATDERDRMIRLTAMQDGPTVPIRGAQDPGNAGVDAAKAFVRLLVGFTVTTTRPTGPKETRAGAFSSQVNAGNVKLVRGAWNRDFIKELEQFPLGAHDDQVDAAADAFNALVSGATGQPASAGGRTPVTGSPFPAVSPGMGLRY